jgi:hypothetical protein
MLGPPSRWPAYHTTFLVPNWATQNQQFGAGVDLGCVFDLHTEGRFRQIWGKSRPSMHLLQRKPSVVPCATIRQHAVASSNLPVHCICLIRRAWQCRNWAGLGPTRAGNHDKPWSRPRPKPLSLPVVLVNADCVVLLE